MPISTVSGIPSYYAHLRATVWDGLFIGTPGPLPQRLVAPVAFMIWGKGPSVGVGSNGAGYTLDSTCTTYTVKDLEGNVVVTGSISAAGVVTGTGTYPNLQVLNIPGPPGGWKPGGYRLQLTGSAPVSGGTGPYGPSYGAANFHVLPDYPHLLTPPADPYLMIPVRFVAGSNIAYGTSAGPGDFAAVHPQQQVIPNVIPIAGCGLTQGSAVVTTPSAPSGIAVGMSILDSNHYIIDPDCTVSLNGFVITLSYTPTANMGGKAITDPSGLVIPNGSTITNINVAAKQITFTNKAGTGGAPKGAMKALTNGVSSGTTYPLQIGTGTGGNIAGQSVASIGPGNQFTLNAPIQNISGPWTTSIDNLNFRVVEQQTRVLEVIPGSGSSPDQLVLDNPACSSCTLTVPIEFTDNTQDDYVLKGSVPYATSRWTPVNPQLTYPTNIIGLTYEAGIGPVIQTDQPHGYSQGDAVALSGITGGAAGLNNTPALLSWTASPIDATHFAVTYQGNPAPNFGSWGGGGVCTPFIGSYHVYNAEFAWRVGADQTFFNNPGYVDAARPRPNFCSFANGSSDSTHLGKHPSTAPTIGGVTFSAEGAVNPANVLQAANYHDFDYIQPGETITDLTDSTAIPSTAIVVARIPPDVDLGQLDQVLLSEPVTADSSAVTEPGNMSINGTQISGLASTSALSVGMMVQDNDNPGNLPTADPTVNITMTGTIAAGSSTLTVPAATALAIGMAVADKDVPAVFPSSPQPVITAIDTSSNTVTLSAPANEAAANDSMTFTQPAPVILSIDSSSKVTISAPALSTFSQDSLTFSGDTLIFSGNSWSPNTGCVATVADASIDGDLTYVQCVQATGDIPVIATGATLTANSKIIQVDPTTASLVSVGDTVYDLTVATNISPSDTVTAVDTTTNKITLKNAVGTSATATLAFSKGWVGINVYHGTATVTDTIGGSAVEGAYIVTLGIPTESIMEGMVISDGLSNTVLPAMTTVTSIVSGTQVSVSNPVLANASGVHWTVGYAVQVETDENGVTLWDDIPNAYQAQQALLESAYVRLWDLEDYPLLQQEVMDWRDGNLKQIGGGLLKGVTQIVANQYPEVSIYEGPSNEPFFNNWDQGVHRMRLFHGAVKAGNPNALVAGIMQVNFDGGQGDTVGLNGAAAFMAHGGGDYVDIFTTHGYNFFNGDLSMGRTALENLMAVLGPYGFGPQGGPEAKPVWITENGFFTAVFLLWHPRRGVRWQLLQMLLCEQFEIPREHYFYYYDRGDTGYWGVPAWHCDQTAYPAVGAMYVLCGETFGKTHAQAYTFGDPLDRMYLASRYEGADGTSVVIFMATSIQAVPEQPVITWEVTGTGPHVTVVDAFGAQYQYPVINDRVTIEVQSDGPKYLRLPAGATAEPYRVAGWPPIANPRSPEMGNVILTADQAIGLSQLSPPVEPIQPGGQLANGVWENSYYNPTEMRLYREKNGIMPLDLVLSFSEHDFDRVTIFSGVPWQLAGSITDFDIHVADDDVALSSLVATVPTGTAGTPPQPGYSDLEASTVLGSGVITLSNPAGDWAGWNIAGLGIPAGSTIGSVSGETVTLAAGAVCTATNNPIAVAISAPSGDPSFVEWSLLATVTNLPSATQPFGSSILEASTKGDSFWDEQWIYDVPVGPQTGTLLCLHIRSASCGGEADPEAHTLGGGSTQGTKGTPLVSIQEIALYSDDFSYRAPIMAPPV